MQFIKKVQSFSYIPAIASLFQKQTSVQTYTPLFLKVLHSLPSIFVEFSLFITVLLQLSNLSLIQFLKSNIFFLHLQQIWEHTQPIQIHPSTHSLIKYVKAWSDILWSTALTPTGPSALSAVCQLLLSPWVDKESFLNLHCMHVSHCKFRKTGYKPVHARKDW